MGLARHFTSFNPHNKARRWGRHLHFTQQRELSEVTQGVTGMRQESKSVHLQSLPATSRFPIVCC